MFHSSTRNIECPHSSIVGFMEPEPSGRKTGQIRVVLRGLNGIQNIPDLGNAEHHRQELLAFGTNQMQSVPLAFEHINEKKLDAAVSDS